MAKSDTIPVQIDAEKLCKYTLKITGNLNNFPKKYRFTLVDRILAITFDIHDNICDGNNSYNIEERVWILEKAIASCRKLKFYIRMCQEVLKPQCSIPYWDEMVSKIEKQLMNWRISIKKNL